MNFVNIVGTVTFRERLIMLGDVLLSDLFDMGS